MHCYPACVCVSGLVEAFSRSTKISVTTGVANKIRAVTIDDVGQFIAARALSDANCAVASQAIGIANDNVASKVSSAG